MKAHMDEMTAQSLTWLSTRVGDEGRANLTQLFPLIYEDLRKLAHRYMDDERSGHTLQPTALVNEAFVKLSSTGRLVRGESHALALAAIAMRSILVDCARARLSLKRGGQDQRFALTGNEASGQRDIDILELNDLLTRFAQLDARRARVVELRFFAGMTNDEIADAIGVARSTIAADWVVAKAWLGSQLGPARDESSAVRPQGTRE